MPLRVSYLGSPLKLLGFIGNLKQESPDGLQQ
jgi:hypothetical protein